jgi:hypothetical protein
MTQLRVSESKAYKERHHKQSKIPNWTPPLWRACRDNRNGYIICLHQNSYEGDLEKTKRWRNADVILYNSMQKRHVVAHHWLIAPPRIRPCRRMCTRGRGTAEPHVTRGLAAAPSHGSPKLPNARTRENARDPRVRPGTWRPLGGLLHVGSPVLFLAAGFPFLTAVQRRRQRFRHSSTS